MTIKEAKKIGLFNLMPNGFNVYDYNTEENITDKYSELGDRHIEIIGVDPEEFIPAIYVNKGEQQ